MHWGTRQNNKEHRLKSKSYITFVIIPDPTKSPKTIKIPKWIRFPLLASVIAVSLWVMVTMTSEADYEYKIADAKLSLQKNTYANSNKDMTISELEVNNVKNFQQLEQLKELTYQLQNRLIELEQHKDNIDTKLNGTKKTTNKQPSGAIQLEASIEPLVAEFNASRSSKLAVTTMSQEAVSAPISDNEVTLTHEPQKELTQDEFNKEVELLISRIDSSSIVLDMESQSYDKINDKVDEMIPYWEAYPNKLPVTNTKITSPYGWRRNPFGKKTSEFHRGVDLRASYGTSVYATGKGKVIFAGYDSIYGRLVVIDHGYGIITKYAHNSKLLVSKGDKVKRGDTVAKSGNSGRSSGPHVHYGVLVNGQPQNPLNYLYREK
ncbi:MAG: M23 family metallopeptidase [Vallitalea sp.]|jgi:murein DD-endopeptidase MepM/ murein hydrolase activator NlpD|nr:M23 family metallopeptidase [Vallitalea sp.]